MARPREFDRDEALRKALQVFWQKGFETTTISDLLKATGLSRSSLYACFGDKESIFREALEAYSAQPMACALAKLSESERPRDDLRRYLRARAAIAMNPLSPGGCLYTYVATERPSGCASVRDEMKDRAIALERAFCAAIRRGQAKRDIKSQSDARILASALALFCLGIDVMARMNPSLGRCERAIDAALAMLD